MSESAPLTALQLPETELDLELRDYFRNCEEKLGFIPNVLKAYAFDNKKLKAFIDMSDDLLLGDSGLSRLEREMIAVAVSAVNHCHYCLTAHGAAVRYRSDPVLGDTVEHNYRAAPITRKQKAMLDFAVKLTEAPDKIENADRDLLRQIGFTDRDIWDIAAVAAFFNMSNRLASAVEMRPNTEYYSMARTKPEKPAEVPAGKAGTPVARAQ